MITQEGLSAQDATRTWVLASTLNFTRYFYAIQHAGSKYIVGEHHRRICEKLDEVLQGKCRRLIINIAPRYGKTLLVSQMFIAAGLAMNPASLFLHLSYSSDLAMNNSMAIKDTVNTPEYQALFTTRIKKGSDTKSEWDTTDGGGVYATSTLGQITGFGAGSVDKVDAEGKPLPYRFAGAIVIDDPIKPEDALSDNVRNSVNRRYETTIKNRVNSRNTPIIIIMQRLHEDDLCGYLMKQEETTGEHWDVLSLPCIQRDAEGHEKALWPFKHTIPELHQIEAANAFVFDTQYMQNPTPLEGLMYPRPFKTYKELPIEAHRGIRKNYTDTADTGSDFLCSIDYVEFASGCYVTDILYTKRPMEDTEPMTAHMLHKDNVEEVNIEANNGGRGFSRNVEKAVRNLGNLKMAFRTFTQTLNKQSRIFTHSNEVQNMIFYPEGWDIMWPGYYQAMTAYRKEGGNEHDDAPDATTGIIENYHGGSADDIDEATEEAYDDLMY